ncbi:MAG: M81 family metallopeptidase, partial [Planctomycetes bacterium]|nr:M81 family metallopeptidase [Planctomycetota bacterium]
MLECHVFSPIMTKYEDLVVYRGEELGEYGPPIIQGMVDRLKELPGVEICPLVFANAVPGGALSRSAYDSVRGETIRLIKEKGPFDGVLLGMHGSLAVGKEHMHGDSDYVLAVRNAVGDSVPLGVAFDLHASLSPEIVRAGNVFSAYRTAPH